MSYSKGLVPHKGTVEKTTYRAGTFDKKSGGILELYFDDYTYYYKYSDGSWIRAKEDGEMIKLDHDQWDEAYDECEVRDVIYMLRTSFQSYGSVLLISSITSLSGLPCPRNAC